MSRHSTHTARARTVTATGLLTELGEVSVSLNLDESQSPYGMATVVCPILEDASQMSLCDPLTHRGIRLLLDLSESVGDPIIISEITTDHTGSMTALTAAYTPAITPSKLTAQYFTAWNAGTVRPGGAIRANLLITGREVSHRDGGTVTFTAQTDEAAMQAYRLMSTGAETSGSTSLRATVNYALAKIGAALLPGSDATIAEASATTWEPGVSGWDYVANVAESLGMVVRCDERRRWTLTARDATLPEQIPFTSFTEGRERIDLTGDQTAEAVIVVYDWTDPISGTRYTRYDLASKMSDPIHVVRIDRSVPYPGPGAAAYWLKRLNSRGRVLDFEGVSDYSLRPGMGFTGALPYAPAQIGWLESISWNLPEAEQSVTTRGAADASLNAIDFWPTGLKIDQLTGKIDALITVGG